MKIYMSTYRLVYECSQYLFMIAKHEIINGTMDKPLVGYAYIEIYSTTVRTDYRFM